MMPDKHKNADPQQIFDQYLSRTGRRRTQERRMNLECVSGISGHFTAEEIVARLASARKPVAVATVYSTLQLLTECGVVCRHRFDDGATRYECKGSSHMHLVCSKCGKIKDVRDGTLDTLIRNRRFSAFTPESFELTVYGVCSACTKAAKAASTKKNNSNPTILSKSLKRK